MDCIKYKIADIAVVLAGGDRPAVCSDIRSAITPVPVYSNGLDNEGLYGYTNVAKVEGDVVTISARGVNVGTVCYRSEPFMPIVRLLSLVPNRTLVDAKYLYYRLKTIPLSGTGSAQPQITAPMIKNTEILIHKNVCEQKQIANFLSALDEKIHINNDINQNLDKQAKAIFKSWFIDYDHWNGQMPSNWIETSLGKICLCELGGTPSRANKDYWNGTIPWINSGEVNNFRIIKPSETITELGLSKSATKLLPVKTTVIAITGATLGQVSLLEIDSCANQSVVGVIPNEKLPYEFIYPLISSKIQELISHQTGGAQQHINKQNVESLTFMMPTQEVVRAYTDSVNALYARIANNCFENERLAELRDSLLPKLMSGELDVSEIELLGR